MRLHLSPDHVVIGPSWTHKLFMRASLDDPPVLHQEDQVRSSNVDRRCAMTSRGILDAALLVVLNEAQVTLA